MARVRGREKGDLQQGRVVGKGHNKAGHEFGLDPKNRKSQKGSKNDMIRYAL